MQEQLSVGPRCKLTPVDGTRDHRPPLVATLFHRLSDESFDLGVASLFEQPLFTVVSLGVAEGP